MSQRSDLIPKNRYVLGYDSGHCRQMNNGGTAIASGMGEQGRGGHDEGAGQRRRISGGAFALCRS